jgi:aspartate kinase
MKFGGTSLENTSTIKRAARIVDDNREGNRIAIVVSALGETTDRLVELGEAAQKQDAQECRALIRQLRNLHTTTVNAVAAKDQSTNPTEVVDGILSELEKTSEGIFNLKELTARSKDYLLSFGERLSAPIVTAALRSRGVRARSFTGAEAGITTDNNFGEARPLLEVSCHQIRQLIEPVWAKGTVPVVTGFLAATVDGSVTTLGRGGSDYTASLLGARCRPTRFGSGPTLMD